MFRITNHKDGILIDLLDIELKSIHKYLNRSLYIYHLCSFGSILMIFSLTIILYLYCVQEDDYFADFGDLGDDNSDDGVSDIKDDTLKLNNDAVSLTAEEEIELGDYSCVRNKPEEQFLV